MDEVEKHKEDIEKALADGITRGIAWSMGFIGGKSHDMPTVAKDMANNAGIKSIQELVDAGVDQFDIDQIGDILPDKYKEEHV